jgi:hypothetical protein
MTLSGIEPATFRLPFSLPPTTRRATVGGTLPRLHTGSVILVIQSRGGPNRKHLPNTTSIVVIGGCLAIARILLTC